MESTKEMREGICCLVGAGDFSEMYFEMMPADYYIAVDGGYRFLYSRGLSPDVTVGDFDSLGMIPKVPGVIQHPQEKDDTDMMLAIQMGIQRGYREFHIYGGTGGRVDHTIANFQLLNYLVSKNAIGYLFGEDYVITALTNSQLEFDSAYEGTVSVFASSEEVTNVDLEGLKYPLKEAELKNTVPIGVSNEFIGQKAIIRIGRGIAWVLWYRNERLVLPAWSKKTTA